MPTPLWERLRDFFMLEFKLRPLPRLRRSMVELWKPQLRGMERERAQTSQAELRLASSLGLMMDVKKDRTAPTSTIGRLWTRRVLLDAGPAAQPSTQREIALSGRWQLVVEHQMLEEKERRVVARERMGKELHLPRL